MNALEINDLVSMMISNIKHFYKSKLLFHNHRKDNNKCKTKFYTQFNSLNLALLPSIIKNFNNKNKQ